MSIKSYIKTASYFIPFCLFIVFIGRDSYPETIEPRALFETRCSKCHSIDKTNRTESAEYWKATVQKMKKKYFSGISDADASVITEYLIKIKTSGSTPPQGKDETAPK